MRYSCNELARAYDIIKETATPVMVTTNVPADDLEFEIEDIDNTEEVGECESSDIEMALNQLRKIIEVAPELLSILESKSDLDGWALIKLAKASDYISGVCDYYKYQDSSNSHEDESDYSLMFQVGYENV